MKYWLVVTISIPKDFAEVISNFLIEKGATGIEEIGEDLRLEKVKAYFPKGKKEKKILRSLYRYLKFLRSMSPEMCQGRIETTSIPDQDWGENWKRFFKPVQVTSTFVVKPPWSRIRLKENQIAIKINPGMAFGTGTHATTKLCLRALERKLRRKRLSVLDMGTGSGILSIAAARLGASDVLGVDIDGVAVENATENVERNQISDIVRIKKGGIGDIQKRFDVIVANIDVKNLRRMRWPLIHHLKDQGFLILSGILKGEGEKLRQHYMETGYLQWVEADQEEEWVCLTFKKD